MVPDQLLIKGEMLEKEEEKHTEKMVKISDSVGAHRVLPSTIDWRFVGLRFPSRNQLNVNADFDSVTSSG